MEQTSRVSVEAVPHVSDLKKHVGFWMRLVSNHVSQAFARRLLADGVTVAEWVVMREMYGQKEISPSVLAERMGMTRGAISRLVDRLAEKRLLTRTECADDRRFQSVALTSAGVRLVPKLAALADENDAEFFSVLSVRQRKELLAVLKELAEAKDLRTLPTE